jgi:WD40 repeat protein
MSAGKDHGVALWRVSSSSELETSRNVDLVAQFVGHSDAVEGLAVSPSGTKGVSCGWDGALLVWRTGG